MRILIFSPEKPYTGAESIVSSKFIKLLLSRGHDVLFVYHERDLIYEASQDPYQVMPNGIGINNSHLIWLSKKVINIPILNKIYLFDTFFWIVKAFFKGVYIHRQKKIDLIISRVMPKYGHYPALFFSLKYPHVKWISNWSDPLPKISAPVPYGKGLKGRPGFLEMEVLKVILKKTNFCSFPSDRLNNYYNQIFPFIKEKSFTIPHIVVDEQFLNPDLRNSDPFTISHLGGFGLRSPLLLIEAFAELIKINPDHGIKFRFIGPIEEVVNSRIRDLGLENYFSIEGILPYEETLRIIQDSDLLLIIEAIMQEGIFLPSKLMDYLQMDKPVFAISPKMGVLADLIGTYGGGIFVDNSSKESILDKLNIILRDKRIIKVGKGQYSTDNLKSIFSEKEVYKKFIKILEKNNE